MAATDSHGSTHQRKEANELLIEDATLSDAAAIAALGRRTFNESFRHEVPAGGQHDFDEYLDLNYTSASLRNQLEQETANHFFVARQVADRDSDSSENVVVGFLKLRFGSTDPCIPKGLTLCQIERVYVSMDWLGTGVGSRLMTHAIEWTRPRLLKTTKPRAAGREDDGVNNSMTGAALWLGVGADFPKTQRFYERFGFVKIGSQDFMIGRQQTTDNVMLKRL